MEEERIALVQLKADINVTGKTLASWVDDKKSNCCEWLGVACSNITRRVVDLAFTYERDYRIGYWYINASVFLPLQQLNVLRLEGNYLVGANQHITTNGDGLNIWEDFIKYIFTYPFCSTSELEDMFTGFDKLAELQNLEVLNLAYNNLDRSILSSLSHLSSLKELLLTGNSLHSALDNPGHGRLSRLSNLEILAMGSTMMEDKNVLSALNLKDFTSLKELYIGSNNFQIFGPINDINALNNLEDLNLGFNFIEGFETIANFSGELVSCNYSLITFFMTYIFSLIF
nr:LRR receptor-like serine/threonine-protein kinase GSO1 [Ipomoea batatas]